MQVSEEKEASAKEDVLDATAPEENKPPPRVDDEGYISATKLEVTISDQEGSWLGSGIVNDSDDSDDSEHFQFP